MTVWEEVWRWRAQEWRAFLRRALLEPRTLCLLLALGLSVAFVTGACNRWSDDNVRVALALSAVALISL